MTTRRKFITTGALGAAATTLGAPAATAQTPIKWRMQTYAGTALGTEVIKPAVDAFNLIAQGQMEIELFYADQLVPTSELFRALQNGTIDAVQSDDDSMASPTEVTVFGGYFPLALRYSLDVPALFNHYGLDEIWKEEYAKVGVKHISAG
ncbi:MAG: TRAP-type C4-dicarboxylate transport system substrate-binding protein, partial [Loktanella salsilacus]